MSFSLSDFLPEARHAGYNVETVSSRGRMYVIMGEHLGESEVYGDVRRHCNFSGFGVVETVTRRFVISVQVWALNVSAATEKQAG